MEHGIYLVLDTSAVRSYMRGDVEVGEQISNLYAGVEFASVPVLCLAEAYRAATSEEALVLDVLANLQSVIVTPVNADDAAFLGGWSQILDKHDLAHAALDAAAHRAALLTSERETYNRILAKEWPIIDL